MNRSESLNIREYCQEDIPNLVSLWSSTFGDSPEFVEGFFRFLPDMGTCILLEKNGELLAEASVISGFEITSPGGGEGPVCGYIYAVAVREDCRGKGYGRLITKAAYEKALEREAEIVCTLPADEELYDFYRSVLGFEPALYRKAYETQASKSEMTMKLSATEYSMFRNSMLAGTQLHPSFFTMDFVRFLCEISGGGLYASESGICTAVKEDDGSCVIHELICRDESKAKDIAASVADTLGCVRAVYYLPAEKDTEGSEKYIAAEPGKIPQNCHWGIALE